MRPEDVIPLGPEEFFAANEYAVMVAENEFLEDVPGLNTNFKIGDRILRLSRTSEARFGLAAMRFFRGRTHDKGYSFLMRMFAMARVMKNGKMKPYFKKLKDGGVAFHEAVYEVAATEKLNTRFEFSPESFLRSVKRVAARMEKEESSNS